MGSESVAQRVSLAIALTAIAALIVGCLAPQTPTPDYSFTLIPTHTATMISQTPVPAGTQAQAAPTAEFVDPNIPVQAAIQALAAALNIPPESITLAEPPLPVQWSDSSLGCPQPDQVYAQVIVPGYLIVLAVGEQKYNVHTDLNGNAVVCFNPEDPIGAGTVPDPLVAEFIEQAKQDLAQRLGISVDEIILVRSEAVDWSDSSLGCAEEGVEYVEVVTSGYRIVLARGEQHYEYHADTHRIFLCANPTE